MARIDQDQGFRSALFELPPQATSTTLADYYLDRTQRNIVQSYYDGPTKVVGAAGTGKTVVALHRAKLLAETGKSVLLCTFNVNLAKRLDAQVREICSPEFACRIRVADIKSVAGEVRSQLSRARKARHYRLVELSAGRRELLTVAAELKRKDVDFLVAEWERFISPRAIWSEEEYVALERTGAARLTIEKRRELWPAFDAAQERLWTRYVIDIHSLCRLLVEAKWEGADIPGYDAVIIDECQDLCLFELQLLQKLCRDPSLLMACGDPAQRIAAPALSLVDAGIKCPGPRTFVLKHAYRSTKQINSLAESVLAQLALEWDGTTRPPADSATDGAEPIVRRFDSGGSEIAFLAKEVGQLLRAEPQWVVGLIVPTVKDGYGITSALKSRGILARHLTEDGTASDDIRVYWQSYNSVKGMEFDVCFLPGLEWESLKRGTMRSESSKSDQDHLHRLLHVLLSRARSQVYISCVGQGVLASANHA